LGLLLFDARYHVVFANEEAICALDPDRQGRSGECTEDWNGAPALDGLRNLLIGFAANGGVPVEFVYAGCACHSISLALPGGRTEMTPEIRTALVVRPPEDAPAHAATFGSMFRLTARETEALDLFMQGLCIKDVAARMKISPSTAKAFLRMITIKMGVSGRGEMMANLQNYMCPASLTCTFRQHMPVKSRAARATLTKL
jgi:DNA-binding CsgD family transcriptional regulator